MYLLDTNVVSELRRASINSGVARWISSVTASDLFMSVVTIGEIELGIERQVRVNPIFADRLRRWLDRTVTTYGDRILPMTTSVARRWGRLAALRGNKSLDLAIAATALEHGLVIATRNVSDFEPAGVKVVDPFDSPAHK